MKSVVLLLLCLIAVIGYVQRVSMNLFDLPLHDELHVNTQQFGAIGSAFLLGYSVLQVPAGWLADRWGSRKSLALCAMAWSLMTALAGQASSYEGLVALWFTMGLAQGGIFPCAAKAIGTWMPATQKATASGLLGSSTMLGTAAASALTAALLTQEEWSWRFILGVYGTAGVVWALAYLLIVPERGASAGERSAPMNAADWRRLVGSGSMWLVSGQQFFRAAAMIFFINWFPKFLRESRGLSEMEAGVFASYASLGAMFGGICGGFFSDWLLGITGNRRLSRQGIAVVGLSIAGSLVLLTHFMSDPHVAIGFFTVGAFSAGFGGVSGYTVTIEFGGRRIGVVFAVMNMCGNIGAAISTYLAGAVVQATKRWDLALFMFVSVFFVDAICWALLNPKEPLFGDEDPPLAA